ncbi:permease [Phaeovibrio sulfidiphilus]|uniref:Permease n=1 Tax=Phaeovibrio sulfidiphilus TaxID=1220600 RepID=A0A8J7CP82_9PROT|nr:permease [Phaeovibrio sulfidiphilus]MBE1236752.1 permease [Phaeovibrio sulfidiphilus]
MSPECDTSGGSGCCCASPAPQKPPGPEPEAPSGPDGRWLVRYCLAALVLAGLWVGAYALALPAATWLTVSVFGLSDTSGLGAAVEFFLYDTVKILLLLVGMIYVVGWLRASLNVERVRDVLAGRGRAVGYVAGSAFGAVTPFCSCSSVPLFLGFTMARIPLGITMAFLITSPLINEIAVVMLWGLLGWKFTVAYVVVGMSAGIIGGLVMDALRADRWLQPFILDAVRSSPAVAAGGSGPEAPAGRLGVRARHAFAWSETRMIFGRVWRWVLVGVAIGAALHGVVPENWFALHLGADQWWSVPAAVVLGMPLYANVTGTIPIMESLLMKGLPVGTTLAFCMGTVAASIPEFVMLRQVMTLRLIAVFMATLLVMFTLVGWIFNAIGPWVL